MTDRGPQVSEADRRALARQATALAAAETDDEGTADPRAARIAEVDRWRAEHDIEPLSTEPELHRLARDRGLLRRVP
ncbi:MAG TPA: hypothetical protein VGO60_09320 [Iamia sp.]|nr:hypothetical protein [Iamia sp.]